SAILRCGLDGLGGLLDGLLHCHVRRSFFGSGLPVRSTRPAAGQCSGSGASRRYVAASRRRLTSPATGSVFEDALVAGATLPSLGRESGLLYPALTAAATAARRAAHFYPAPP